MSDYEVWLEGYAATGNSSTATFCGVFHSDSFADAVEQYIDQANGRQLFDKDKLTYWGCRFFDNETAARESFG